MSPSSLLYLINHVFLPPQLPQEDDQTLDNDKYLCHHLRRSAITYQMNLPSQQRPRWDPILRMVENLAHTQEPSAFSPETIENQISRMCHGDILAFLIRAQNAGVILRKFKTRTVFEAFEVAPPAKVVMGAKGKLLCSYPGPVIEIPSDVVDDPFFRQEFASFLSQMHGGTLDSAATTRKAGSTMVEERDTAHPRYITQLLTGILRGMGQPAEITRIRKRIADDVLWKDTKHPWRRSSLWLILRVAIQTSLHDPDAIVPNADYKAFMVFAMAKMLQDVLRGNLPSDVIFCMRAKVSRRLYKIGISSPEFVQEAVRDVGEAAEQLLQERWLQVQNRQAQSPPWNPDDLNIIADTRLSLDNSTPYLTDVIHSRSSPTPSTVFKPHHAPRFRLNFQPDSSPCSDFISLADFELLVQDDLDRWVQDHMVADSKPAVQIDFDDWMDYPHDRKDTSIDSTCTKLAACVESYHQAASKIYASNPEDTSLMFLTILELWVALDKLVLAQIPLLADYSPEIPIQMLEPLILRKEKPIQRLALIVRYLRQRHNRSRQGLSVFTSKWSTNSFAVRYFQTSQAHQSLKSRIESDASAKRSAKLEELQRKTSEYDSLLKQANSLSCEYAPVNKKKKRKHATYCRKCSLEQQAQNIQIDVYEWPLSQNTYEAQVTVVELECPVPFSIWRATTYTILFDMCTSHQSGKTRADPPISLKTYNGLKKYLQPLPLQAQRISLASTTKSFLQSHYRTKRLPATEQQVCVNNGLQFALFDSSENVWAANRFVDVNIAKSCTFQLPSSSPYKFLQYAVDGTTHTSNQVIANQSDCHWDVNLHEYIAFASLRACGRLQWLNIARELPARSLTFRCEEVACLLKQAAEQIGPLSEQNEWDWHRELVDVQFGRVLLTQLEDLIRSIKANWLEGATMRSIITLTNRLLASTTGASVIHQAYSILREARDVTFGWMRQLTERLQENEDECRIGEIQQCRCEMAITCRTTYDVDPVHVKQLLTSTQDVAMVLECAIVAHDNQPPELSEIPPAFKLLLDHDRRLSHFLEPAVRERIKATSAALDQAVSSLWTAYHPGTAWRHRLSPDDRWISCETGLSDGATSQRVDLNLLNGCLLIDGKALGRLPKEITRHPTYARIFGRKIFDIIPSDMPGVEYASRTRFFGYQIFFSLREKENILVVRTRRDTEVLELIPHEKFRGDVPTLFVTEYAHWINLISGDIEFRPLQNLWTSSPDNWWIRSLAGGCAMMQGSRRIVDIRTPTFKMMSSRLGPLEYAEYLTVIHCPNPSPSLSVELPRFRLSFFVNESRQLESHNLPGMEVDEDQSSGTMFGLVNQLVLRTNTSVSPGRQPSRYVLVPFGKVEYKLQDFHTLITVDTTSQRKVAYHKYRIDSQLGRLVSNVSLVSKLYKVFLHAVTSHCLPDPLTGCTGTEEALNELRSASCWSFQSLTDEEIDILEQISSLHPGRTFYPQGKKVMQTVKWLQLPAIAQHDGYWAITEQILDYARRLRLSQDDGINEPPSSDPKIHLLERAANRNAIYYSESLRTLFQPITDVEYSSRDLDMEGEMAACNLSAATKAWSTNAHTSSRLFHIMTQWGYVSGPRDGIDLFYSPDWLKLDLPDKWMSLYNLCRQSNRSENRWQLAFCLCAFQYSATRHDQLASVLLSFATIAQFGYLPPPAWTSYDLSHGCEAQRSTLQNIVRRHAIRFEDSPAYRLPSEDEEDDLQLSRRRRSHYDTQRDKEVSRAVELLMGQWPSELHLFNLSATHFAYLDLPKMMAEVRRQFQTWYHNKQLRDHIEQVQSILDQYSRQISQPTASSYTFAPCRSNPISMLAHVSRDNLFVRGAPKRMQTPTTLAMNSTFLPSSRNPCSSTPQQPQSPHASLQEILAEFQSNASNPFHQLYGHCLAASQHALFAEASESIPDLPPISLIALLQENKEKWATHLHHLLESIRRSLRPRNQVESIVSTAGLWPRLTLRSLLSMLTHSVFQGLSVPWQQALMSLGQSLLSFQRVSRLVSLAQSSSHEDFWKELQNSNVDAMRIPDWQLIQVDNDFLARPIQIRCAKEMIEPSSQQNSVFQLNMGEGKSSVIVPLTSSVLADGQKLVRVVVLKALANQMFHLLVERLSGLANRRIFYMPFSRATDIGTQQARLIQSLYDECVRVGGILVVQPEHILSFKLMGIDHSLRGKDRQATAQLLETQRWLENRSRDILDESDEILHVRYQLVYTVGFQQPIDHHPDRWVIIQQVLSLARKHAGYLQNLFPVSVEVGESHNGSFPHIRILHGVPVVMLTAQIAEDIISGCLPNFSFALLPGPIRRSTLTFMHQLDVTPQSVALIKDYFVDNVAWNSLLLLRGLLAHGILGYVLTERRWRVDYGLDFTRSLLAVPYRAKDVPALRAEFGHPDVAIILTCLSYYYQGLTDDQLIACFDYLLKLDNPTMEYESWIRANPHIPPELREIRAVNVRDTKQLKDLIVPHFHRNQAVVNFFLAEIVFPKEAKEFPEKIATSGWDIAECKKHSTTGFSGTNDNQYLLPTSIVQCDPLGQTSTNAKVLAFLLQPENDGYICFQKSGDPRPSAQELLSVLVNQEPNIQVLLDVGAQILDMRNKELVQNWLKLRRDMPAAIFFDDNDHMAVMTQDGTIEAFISSPFNQQLDKCLVYLDDVHTRGTDLKLPRQSRAAVTLGPKVTKDRLLQGAMRMRKLGHGQSVLFIAPQEIDQKIRKTAGKSLWECIRTTDILRWVMHETCADIQHHIPHWSQQGVDYLRRKEDWSKFCSSESADASVLKRSWLQVEARTLEHMYGSGQRSDSTFMATLPPEIQERCRKLGVSSFQDTRMEEEQEREVVHEIERERQVERPPKVKPAIHRIHDRLRTFVQTGKIGQLQQSLWDTSAFSPIHIAAKSPSAWSPNLVVTHDFRTTIQDVNASHTAEDYLRPVHWILSSNVGGDSILVVASAYEVHELLPEIRRSKYVHLHLYAPRVTQTMISFDDLRFYCIPPLPTTWMPPTPNLVQQLNLFAGQLYLPDYDSYQRLCTFLGLYSDNQQSANNAQIQSDGFVKPIHRRGTLAHLRDCQFEKSPLPILRDLFGYRRKGMSYVLTHMGKLLHATLLTKDDFILVDQNVDEDDAMDIDG